MRGKSKTFPMDAQGSLLCDVDTLIDTRLLVQGGSGGGKSWLLRYLLEQTHGYVQQIVIDPEGEFASLREKYDYVHAAPSGGDTVANPRSAALLAEKLLDLGVSAICDIYELHPHDRIRFVKLFLEALVNAPKRLWHPVLVVVDEAHLFAPEKGKAESLNAMVGLASLGRKRGFAAVYATQRIQKLHKDACADLVNKLVGRTTLDVDVKRAAEELGFLKERWRDLKGLRPGQFFATGPAFNHVEIVQVSVGAVHTTHPKAGKKRIAFTPPPPTAKIRALLPQLSDLPAEAETRQKTLDELRADNTRLKRELEAKPKPAPAAVVDAPRSKKEDVATIRSLRKGLELAMKVIVQISGKDLFKVGVKREEIESVLYAASLSIEKSVGKSLDARSKEIARLVASAKEVSTVLRKLLDEEVAVAVNVSRNPPFATTVTKEPPRTVRVPAARARSTGGLGTGERAVLVAIAQHGEAGVDREQIAVLTGYKTSTRNAYIARLRAAGLITDGTTITATDEGVETLGSDFEPLPRGAALRDHWIAKLPEGERVLFALVLGAYPGTTTRDYLGDNSGYKTSTKNAYLSRLATRKLIVAQRDGGIRASDTLFLDDA